VNPHHEVCNLKSLYSRLETSDDLILTGPLRNVAKWILA